MACHGRTTGGGEQAITSFELEVDPDETIEDVLEEASDDADENTSDEEFTNLLVLENKRRINEGYGEPRRMEYSEDYALTVLCEILEDSINVQAMFGPEVIAGTEMNMILGQFTDILRMLLSGSSMTVEDLQQIGPQGLEQVSERKRLREAVEDTPTIHEMIEQ